MRRAFLLGALAVIGLAVVLVPMPLLAVSPAPALPVPSAVEVAGGDEISGTYLLTAVELRRPSIARAAGAWLDDQEEVLFARQVVPQGVDEEEFTRLQRRLFEESVRVAAAVGMRAAGLDVQVSGQGARVEAVVPGSPADGTLEQGDVIVRAGGRKVELASQLAAITEAARAGETLELVVRRGDERRTVEVEVREVEELGRPGIGVAVSTLGRDIELPRELSLDAANIGGPSGGLMLALTVHDRIVDEDLTGGRVVAGTGTIALDGGVGSVGEVDLKVEAARRAGADVFLVPAAQAEEAESAASGDLEVVPVETFEEAVDALRGGAGTAAAAGSPPPRPDPGRGARVSG